MILTPVQVMKIKKNSESASETIVILGTIDMNAMLLSMHNKIRAEQLKLIL